MQESVESRPWTPGEEGRDRGGSELGRVHVLSDWVEAPRKVTVPRHGNATTDSESGFWQGGPFWGPGESERYKLSSV